MSPDASYLEHQQRHEEEKLQHCISALTDDDRKAIFILGMYVYIHIGPVATKPVFGVLTKLESNQSPQLQDMLEN